MDEAGRGCRARCGRCAIHVATPAGPLRHAPFGYAGAPNAIIEEAGHTVMRQIGTAPLATFVQVAEHRFEQSFLEPAMTIAIEPSVYAPGAFNIKNEDDALTQKGARSLR